ncbi:uncharacterized protein [Physcomitrium patens]|uniref:uncharacterized protein n=1 Tax=Physcomitrium patens TaxID=3218 RepID=UPI003CCCA474
MLEYFRLLQGNPSASAQNALGRNQQGIKRHRIEIMWNRKIAPVSLLADELHPLLWLPVGVTEHYRLQLHHDVQHNIGIARRFFLSLFLSSTMKECDNMFRIQQDLIQISELGAGGEKITHNMEEHGRGRVELRTRKRSGGIRNRKGVRMQFGNLGYKDEGQKGCNDD